MQHDLGNLGALGNLGKSAASSPSASQQPTSPTTAGRKRKAPSSGSRGVASLTPEQLAKKRANDREAQRAIRERTKQQIETLERRIQELTSQQPYQELQAVIRQKDAIQAENDEIRRRLASIMSIIQPIVGAQGLTDLATAAQHNLHNGLSGTTTAFHGQLPAQPESYMSTPQNGRMFSPPAQGPMVQGGLQQPQYSASQAATQGTQSDETGENRQWASSRDALSHQRDNLHRGLELNDSGERLSFNFLLDSLGQRPTSIPPQMPIVSDSSPRSAYPALTPTPSELPPMPWTVIPKNVAPTCPLDQLLLNFLHSRQHDAAASNASSALYNPSYPSVSSLLNPSSGRHQDPLSQLMTDIISKFPNISALPEQAAVLFFMFIFMRWHINPTRENYERLPECMRSTPNQLYTPHPAWIDHIPWPRMRDKLISNYEHYAFENWFIPFTSELSVNWPYDPVDCLLSTSESEDPMINPVFERHIRRIENWSVGPGFAEAFPALVDTTRIKSQEVVGSSSRKASNRRGS